MKLYPVVPGTQSVFNCLKAALTAAEVHGPQQVALARKLRDHAVRVLLDHKRVASAVSAESALDVKSLLSCGRALLADTPHLLTVEYLLH